MNTTALEITGAILLAIPLLWLTFWLFMGFLVALPNIIRWIGIGIFIAIGFKLVH